MKILIVNDDGIEAAGIVRLARMARRFGEVCVVAPDRQCSAMSQRITVRGDMEVRRVDFPVEGVQAYSVSGTPADCVKAAFFCLLPERPDLVFSGINCGYNVGLDILYSGTVGAAMEALVKGIPAIAFSSEMNGVYDVVDAYLLPLTEELLARPIARNEIWNINFPGCTCGELRGVLWDRVPSEEPFYWDNYSRRESESGNFILTDAGIPTESAAEGTDSRAVLDRYISIGKIRNMILKG